ncbi:MAG: ABC transporter ATP-binding protein [Clostridia bacterium]|nr:ABC transporter ATP-binding protein [Clostridia bacterium]
MISIKNLKKSFRDKVVFDGFSLDLPECGAYFISGPSGCGKTTLLRIISGLDTEYEGDVVITGKISYVFQENRLLPTLSAYENVFAVCRDKEKTSSMLYSVGLSGAFDKRPDELSGGMNRRVAIARALCYPHDILLLDEPFTALDGDIKANITELIKELEKDRLTVLVTHDRSEADALGCTEIKIDAEFA